MSRKYSKKYTGMCVHKQCTRILWIRFFSGQAHPKILFYISCILFFCNTSGYGQTELTRFIDYSLGHSHEIKTS
jgi:hypothetical protein